MKYRREIDGLRAVAVMPVILFHAGFAAFSGGFVGVDIFFVISGYLITTIILADLEKGKFSLTTFYERRARRILPALFFVMLCCLPFAWLWLAPAHLKNFSQSLAAVSAFSSNFLFWYESGYFSTASELTPLLHTWSLAVEEQYYVLFPLFLMLLWRLRKRWIFAILIVIAVVSLAAAQWGAYSKPSAAFFLLPARAWELAVGALIAFYFLYKKKQEELVAANKIASEVFGLLGFGLILYSIVTFDESTPFPSCYALIPTIGTALIILFSTAETAVGRFLGTKLMVGIGLISYSTYLWHQPLFVFTRHRSVAEPNTILLLILFAVTISLAYFSWRFVEEPFRNKNMINKKSVFYFAVGGSIFFTTVGLTGHINNGYAKRFNLPSTIVDSFKENNLSVECKNQIDKNGVENLACIFGNGQDDPGSQVAVFGDSHASALLPAFAEAGKKLNYSFAFMGKAGCPPLLGVDVAKGNYRVGVCKQLSEQQYEYVKDHKIKKVFLVSRWSLYTDDQPDNTKMYNHFLTSEKSSELTRESSRASFNYAVKNTVDLYAKIGVQVFVILQVPQHDMSAYDIYCKSTFFEDSKINEIIKNMSKDKKLHEQFQKYNRDIFKQYSEKINLINLDSIFCHEDKCYIGEKLKSYYKDDDHLSTYGATLTSNKIIEKLRTHDN